MAKAAANEAIDSLDRCMRSFHVEEVETHRAGFRPPGADPMPDRLLGVLRHQAFEFSLGLLVLEMYSPGPRKDTGELRPRVGGVHVDNAYRLESRSWRFDPKQGRSLSTLNATPELALGGEDEMLIKRIGTN